VEADEEASADPATGVGAREMITEFLRDGMSIQSMEYIFSQSNESEDYYHT